MRPMKFGFGQPVRRVEDHRLTTGTGRYTDDIAAEGALHAYVLRSQYAHARFAIRDKEAARKMKGVMSEGMLFDIGYADGLLPVLAMPEAFVPDGAQAG